MSIVGTLMFVCAFYGAYGFLRSLLYRLVPGWRIYTFTTHSHGRVWRDNSGRIMPPSPLTDRLRDHWDAIERSNGEGG